LTEADLAVAPDDTPRSPQQAALAADAAAEDQADTEAAPPEPEAQALWQDEAVDQTYADTPAEPVAESHAEPLAESGAEAPTEFPTEFPTEAPAEPSGAPGAAQPVWDRQNEAPSEPEAMPPDAMPVEPLQVSPPDSDAGGAEPAPPPARRGTPVLALLLGGVLATGLGFVAARYVIPEGWPITLSTERINALDRKLAAQEKQIADLRAAPAATDPRIDAALADIAAARTAAAEAVAALETRLAALEQRPAASADTSGLSAEIDALKSALAALQTDVAARPAVDISDQIAALTAAAAAERQALEARAAALQEETRAAATAATARGVLLRLQAALETGGPIGPLLEELIAAGVTVPQALGTAADGVPTLTQLQAAFPEAARTALAAAIKVAPDAGLGDRVATFLRVQTGARSLTPRDGDDPDAILSRAEAALRGGDLTGALGALDALPPEAQAAMTTWRDSATARAAAVAAADELATGLTGN
jgi:hypothetical protein